MSIEPLKQVNEIYGYVRVSTREQVRSGISLDTQKKNIEEFSQAKYNRSVDRFGDGKLDWAARGYSIGGGVPYGYRKVREKHGNKMRSRLVEDEYEQRVLKTVRRLSDRGEGCRRIARQCNSLHAGCGMTHHKVDRILNRKYQGLSTAS
jgi:DNA invertase Pin-like site-specific DNA recombinase